MKSEKPNIEEHKESHANSRSKAREACRKLGQKATDNGVRQIDLAEYIGYTQGNLSRLFNGKHTPGLDAVFYVLNAINELKGTSYTLKDIDIVAPTGSPENKA